MSTTKLPSSDEEMLALLGSLSDEELQELLDAQTQLEARLSEQGPQTDDELHEWLKFELGIDIPKVAVCEGHDAPFQFLADLFFERIEAALGVANRGGAKTFLVAVLHWLNSRFKPGCESCVAADTPVDCPRDHRRFPDGVPISQIKPGQLVWTFNEQIRRFELKPVVEARMTRKGVAVFKLTLDSGHVIRATADHRFMRRDGSWAELRELKPGDSLMPLYRDWEPYVRVNPDARGGGQMVPEYKAVANTFWPGREKGSHVDHIDERRENSGQDNLQVMTPSEHCSKTMTGRNFGLREPKQKMTLAEAGRKGGSASPPLVAHECSCGEIFYRQPGGRQGLCPACKTEARCCPICGEHFIVARKSRRDTCGRSCGQKMRHQKEAGVFNHKIVSIEPDGSEDVWDMEVEGNHNFVVHGVVLHNCTFGAIEAQSFRAYAHLKNWIYDEDGNLKETVVSSLMRDTTFRNGSKIEVLGSTPDAVNGPHPQKAHADEVELMRDDTFRESRNMTVSKKLKDGRTLIPQDILTSTRKGPSGRVQQLIDEIEEAIAHGYKPPRKLYIWCIKETSAQVKNCRIAKPNVPDALKCPCNKIKRGEWEDGTPRTLDQICCGDFHKSRGWQPYGDIVKQFTENDRETFEAQVLCAKPEMRWHYVPNWRDEKHLIRGFLPRPGQGPIFMSVDWGGTNPHAVTWYQLLTNEIDALTWVQPEDGNERYVTRVAEGTLVAFNEIYIAEIGNEKLGEMVKKVESGYRKMFGPRWFVNERFADPQGKAARMDWKAMDLKTSWHATREFDEHTKAIRAMFDDDLFRCAGDMCPKFIWEIKQWRIDERTGNQLDINNHAMSNFRYAVANIKKIRKRALSTGVPGGSKKIQRQTVRITRPGANAPIGFRGNANEFDRWRASLGETLTRGS